MIDTDFDVIIIGAGPSGCIAAYEILRLSKEYCKDFKIAIFEEHNNIGEPMQCAGLISIDGLKKLDIDIPKRSIMNTVKGAIFYSPNNEYFKIKAKKSMAYVIDRRIFDKYLAYRSIKSGAQLYLGAKVIDIINPQIQYSDNGNRFPKISVKIDNKIYTYTSKLILNGEGIKGLLTKKIGFSIKRNIASAIQLEFNNIDIIDKELVELYFGRKISPGFFAYIIPTSKNSARIEASSVIGNPYHYLLQFINQNHFVKNRIKNCNIIEVIGGSILLSGPIKRTYTNNILLIGDAAGHVKPTTGGGVILGGLCAKIAAQIVVESLINKNYTMKFLKKYDLLWRKEYNKEFKLMKLVRSVLNYIPDKILDILVKLLNDYSFNQIVESYGDMDFQSNVIKKVLLSKKSLLLTVGFFLNILKYII